MSSQLDQDFQKAADEIANLSKRPGDDELLAIYGLYKQGTLGDCDQPKPGMFQLKEKAKYEIWNQRKGMAKDEAKKQYIEAVKKLIEKYGLK